jgi:hypothetical protein
LPSHTSGGCKSGALPYIDGILGSSYPPISLTRLCFAVEGMNLGVCSMSSNLRSVRDQVLTSVLCIG